ncbi:hypothetical protein E4T45_09862 [Aureobasidium sp. EXF-8846]|nr:hypothetical protein E4T45_09862 [Aureobasidium sp. EXF-8846]
MLRRTRRCELFPSVPERFTIFGNVFKSHIFNTSTPRQGTDVEMVEIGPASATAILPPSTQPCKLRGLVFRSLIGTLLILGWGVINSTIFYITGGKEHMWLCFTQCNMDLCVLHWLTANPKDHEKGMKATRLSITELPQFLRDNSIAASEPVKLSASSSSSAA